MPLLMQIPVIMDTKIVNLNKVNFGSGHHLYGLEIFTRISLNWLTLKSLIYLNKNQKTNK